MNIKNNNLSRQIFEEYKKNLSLVYNKKSMDKINENSISNILVFICDLLKINYHKYKNFKSLYKVILNRFYASGDINILRIKMLKKVMKSKQVKRLTKSFCAAIYLTAIEKIIRPTITVIGAGLAGSEASIYLANNGYHVDLYEMRPSLEACAHHTDKCGELVCSNSLKSMSLENAAGLLKKEMEVLGSLVIEAAYKTRVPAGQALAVDRDGFASYMDEKIKSHSNINLVKKEVTTLPKNGVVVVASGPLTSSKLSDYLKTLFGEEYFYFYDAAAPLVLKDSLDFNKCYYKSRYDKGDGDDYINCAFTKEEFMAFYEALISAQRVELKSFEKELHFEACMPIESIAKRGYKTLTFGPMKPKGLERPDGTRPYAVVQLRQDDARSSIYNIVGFQTNLLFKEQERIFKMIPGLENAKFIRYGVMHRNTFINSPRFLDSTLSFKKDHRIFFAGQMVGVEGYIESAASGIVAAINAIRFVEKKELVTPPKTTVLGALLNYISTANPQKFQPMNANYGVLASPLKDKIEIANKSLEDIREWREKVC